MKIILTHEVTGLGEPGDVVDVKDGYGRNYLLPEGLAIPATKGAERQVADIKRARRAREVRDLDHANEIKARLGSIQVRLRMRSGKEGRLFGSVTTQEVVAAVAEAGGPELDRRRVQLPSGIKSTGKYQVSVVLHPDVTASFSVDVVAVKKQPANA